MPFGYSRPAIRKRIAGIPPILSCQRHCRHLSLRRGEGSPSRGGCYPPLRVPLRRERTASRQPAPPALLPLSQRSRLAAALAGGAGALLPHPFTPHLCPRAIGGSALCCRLASASPCGRAAPTYGFVGWPSPRVRGVGESGSSSARGQRRLPERSSFGWKGPTMTRQGLEP